MAKCPKCNKEIDYLYHCYYIEAGAYLSDNDDINYAILEDCDGIKSKHSYKCPKCEKTIIKGKNSENRAIKFMYKKDE